MRSIATLFSGGEGVGIGARAAGLRHLWGIEHDADIAAVARKNGFDVLVGDVRNTNLASMFRPDVLHASPPCPNFSSAKTGGAETALDIELGQATARFIYHLRPRWFTLENVWKYRESQSWRIIAQALAECGYFFDVAHLNAADAGVPQTRKRMWVRAVRGGMVPHLPPPETWVGWYAAIEDLIPGLPDTEFAPWQLERMPAELRETVLLAQGHYGDDPLLTRSADDPAYTVTANSNMGGLRALLFSNQNSHDQDGNCYGTVMRDESAPAMTIRKGLLGTRAFIAGATSDGFATRDADEPANTVLASNPRRPTRAFIIDGANAGQDVPTIRAADEPTFTVIADSERAVARAAINGRVVRMTTRCLARFQSLPDDYVLSGKKGLDARVIGNAVPPVQYAKLIRSLTR